MEKLGGTALQSSGTWGPPLARWVCRPLYKFWVLLATLALSHPNVLLVKLGILLLPKNSLQRVNCGPATYTKLHIKNYAKLRAGAKNRYDDPWFVNCKEFDGLKLIIRHQKTTNLTLQVLPVAPEVPSFFLHVKGWSWGLSFDDLEKVSHPTAFRFFINVCRRRYLVNCLTPK
jgi:hypothetical protein